MNGRTTLSLVVAILMGLAALYVGKNLVTGNRPQKLSVETSAVVVATRDLEPGRPLEMEDLCTADMPAEYVSKTAVRDTKSLVGRVLLTSVVKGLANRSPCCRP